MLYLPISIILLFHFHISVGLHFIFTHTGPFYIPCTTDHSVRVVACSFLFHFICRLYSSAWPNNRNSNIKLKKNSYSPRDSNDTVSFLYS